MPTYVYRRQDGTTFEVVQRITEDPLTEDPATGQPVQRVISGAGLIFKGEGFYLTDYARKSGAGKGDDKPAEKPAKAADAKAPTETKKPAAAAA
jgi:putative FmdB family regulatory protein